MVAGNKYPQCDSLGGFGVLDEVSGLTVGRWGWNYIECLKR